jgi:hypothetical protein
MVGKVLCHDGILIRDGALGGSEGALPFGGFQKAFFMTERKLTNQMRLPFWR